MPRVLRVAPATAQALAASVAGVSYKSLMRMVRIWDLEAKVIAAWIIWLILRQLQSYLGPMRRRSRHKVVQYGAMAAYYLPSVLAFYGASAMHSSTSGFKVELSLGCALLLVLSGTRGPVAMTALTLGRGPHRRLIPWLLFGAWLQWDSISSGRRQTVSDLISYGILFLGPVIYAVAAKPRVAALDYETKQFADCMMRGYRWLSSSSSSSPLFDDLAESLYDGCKYPFTQQDDGRWISFSDVLQNRGWLLPCDCADQDQADTCLSYTFCRLLARRYFGFPCAEDGNRLVREFVLKELVADYNRAFTVVEVQLALLHDYFFTNYHSYVKTSAKKGMVNCFNASVIFVAGAAASFIIRSGYKQGLSSLVVFLYASAVPVALMYIMIAQQQFPSLPRYWHPIQNLFMYYSTATTGCPSGPCVIDRSASPQGQSSRLYYWRDKLGQYSVVEDYDRRSAKKTIMAWCTVHVLSQVSYGFIKHHPAQGQEVRVPDSVRRLVAQAMKDRNGPPTIVTKSLLVRDDLLWTYRQETLTHTILIWHIATCCCDMLFQSQALAVEADTNREAATILSRYCAYLVAFLPELLPDHALSAKVVLQQVLQETRDLLGTTRMSMEAKITRIQQLQLAEDESSAVTNFQKGVQLGRQLEQQPDVSLRWKAMADFWVEMILHLASSSENVAAHVEQLAQGGEFVTHLWALLCNAGVTLKTRTS